MGSYNTGGYSLGGSYIDPSDGSAKNLCQMKDHYYQSAYPQNASYWQQGSIDKRFKVGDQNLWAMIYGDNNYYNSRRFFFNLIRRQLNMINGYQRRNRKSTVTMPNYDGDEIADQYNGVLKWCENRDGFQEYLSQAFENSNDTGMSLLHLYPDYSLDPISGDLFTDCVTFQNFLIDPYFRKQDFSDCNFIWRRRWVSKQEAKNLLPGHAKEIDKMRPSGMKDGRFPLQAELLNMATNNLFAYDEFYYRATRDADIIIDPMSGESMLWESDEEGGEDELKQVLYMQPWLVHKKTQVPTVKLCLSLGDRIFYDGPNLLNIDYFPFVPSLCYYEPDIQSYAWRCQGIIRNLRDTQYLYNMRKVIEMDILQSQVNSGWIYPVDSVVDPKSFRQSGQGFVIPLKAGHLPNELQRIEAPGLPQTILELSRSLAEDMPRISGVNEELLGGSVDAQAGITEVLRQGAGLTTLQGIFDRLDYTQRLYGFIRLQAIRKNFSKGKVKQILGYEPSERFFTSHSLKYSVVVEEGNYSATQRQMELTQLLHFREMGMNVADKTIWRAAFITNKAQAEKEAQEQAEQQAQAQQQQAQQQAQVEQSKVMASYAKARSDLALEKERMASALEKEARIQEIQAQAEHKETQADLDLVKMMLDLEAMDLETMRKSFDMAQAIKQSNEQLQTQEAIL